MNKSYNKGRRFEYEVLRLLKERGYNVLRTAGSHGCFDLVAFNDKETIFIQCKLSYSNKDIEDLKKIKVMNGAHIELWTKIGHKIEVIRI